MGPLIAIGAGTILMILIVVLIAANSGKPDKKAAVVFTPAPTPVETPTPVPTEAPTPTPVPTPTPMPEGLYAPAADPGYLPVFKAAETNEKVIAITVDDCFQVENLRQIVQAAEDVGGKLTIFPIGKLLQRENLQEVIRYAYHTLGFEIENHTYTHNGLFACPDEELAWEISSQDYALDYVLGVDYQTNFLRPRGGDARNDLRMHSYAAQMGYKGIAHWSISGSGSKINRLIETLAPGHVYLFHTTDSDLEKLQQFIPYAVSQGYRLVTLNEMFGYAPNKTAPLTDDPLKRETPPLQPYVYDYKKIENRTFSYAAYRAQQRLIELGFLDGEPDGDFGQNSADAVKRWQNSIGVAPDGVLTAELQKRLFDTEPASTPAATLAPLASPAPSSVPGSFGTKVDPEA